MSGFSSQDEVESDEEDWGQTLEEHVPSKSGLRAGLEPGRAKGEHAPKNESSHKRIIIHVDLDCFYAQVEMIRNPELRDKPLGIQQKNIIVTCNYVARSRGLTKLMYLKEAQEKCPDLVIVKGEDLTHYREMSYQVTDLLLRYSPTVERLGMDENYVDVSHMVDSDRWSQLGEKLEVPGFVYIPENGVGTAAVCSCGCEKRMRIGAHIAKYFRDQLHSELGLTSCAGISHNKVLAKLVGSTHKPNKQTLLQPHLAESLMLSLGECRKIPGIGRSMAKKLATLGVVSVGDLKECSMGELEEEFGTKNSRTMRDLSFGIDESAVTVTGKPQTMSDEDSFKKCSDFGDAKRRMQDLLRSLLTRVADDKRIPQTVRVTVRPLSQDWHRESRQCPIPASVTSKIRHGNGEAAMAGLLQVCSDLFQKLVNVQAPFHLTLINIAFCKLAEGPPAHGIAHFFGPQTAMGSRPLGPAGSTAQVAACRPPAVRPHTLTGGHGLRSICDQRQEPSLEEMGLQNLKKDKCGPHSLCQTPPSPAINSKSKNNTSESQATCGVKRRSEHSDEETQRTCHKKAVIMEEDGPSRLHKTRVNAWSEDMNDGETPSGKNVKHSEITPGGTTSARLSAPPGVDPDVFSALPHEFQLEVIAQYKTNNSTPNPKDREPMPSCSTSPSDNNVQTNNAASSARKTNVKTISPRQSITSFLTKRKGDVIVEDTSCGYAGQEKQSICKLAVRKNDVKPSTSSLSPATLKQNSTFMSDVKNSNTKACCLTTDHLEIPPDIDRDVFTGLPPEIQQELVADWKRRLAEKTSTAAGGAKVPVTEKKRVSGQRSLDMFLKKK